LFLLETTLGVIELVLVRHVRQRAMDKPIERNKTKGRSGCLIVKFQEVAARRGWFRRENSLFLCRILNS
jgi:hypothetical protein